MIRSQLQVWRLARRTSRLSSSVASHATKINYAQKPTYDIHVRRGDSSTVAELNFHDTRETYRSKSNFELIRSMLILKTCTYQVCFSHACHHLFIHLSYLLNATYFALFI